MNKTVSAFTAGVCAALLSGCVTAYPLGMSEAEWNALSQQQQFEARMKQAELDEKAERRRAAEAKRREAAERRAEIARKRERADRFRRGEYGDFVWCEIADAKVDFRPGWYTPSPITFKLVEDFEEEIRITDRLGKNATSIWAEFYDRSYVRICQRSNARGQCRTLKASGRELKDGASRDINMSEILRGTLTCRYTGR